MSTTDPTFRYRQVTIGTSSLHVVEAGDPDAASILFVHGWPQSWRTWQPVVTLASRQVRALAIDLPGIGQSTGAPTDGSKQQIAATISS